MARDRWVRSGHGRHLLDGGAQGRDGHVSLVATLLASLAQLQARGRGCYWAAAGHSMRTPSTQTTREADYGTHLLDDTLEIPDDRHVGLVATILPALVELRGWAGRSSKLPQSCSASPVTRGEWAGGTLNLGTCGRATALTPAG